MTETEARKLLPSLSSPDANKRLDAAIKLGYPGLSLAVPDLMRLAKSDPDRRVRKAAIGSLGTIGDRSAYPLLESIWKDSSQPNDVRNEALDACDRMDGVDDLDDDQGGTGGRPGKSDSSGGL